MGEGMGVGMGEGMGEGMGVGVSVGSGVSVGNIPATRLVRLQASIKRKMLPKIRVNRSEIKR